MNRTYISCAGKTSGRASVILSFTIAFFGASARAAEPAQIINPFGLNTNTLQALELNKQKQIQASRARQSFHGFQFSDRCEESGIRFEHRPVDDAAKDYK